jgi:hypothetical protein
MIVSCIKCNKKFNVLDKLIPESGRILQCGSCLYQWHYVPIISVNLEVAKNETEDKFINEEPVVFDDKNKEKIQNNKKINSYNKKKKIRIKKVKFLNKLLVGIITFIALIIIIDTFRIELSKIIPNVDLYLYSLYETIKDIYLFSINLIK